jgi:hypothetical protein
MVLRRNTLITIFVACWIALFHYETLRANYLEPLVRHRLPKVKFLFPPAGWIMFFNVDPSYGFAEVYGHSGSQLIPIDPHDIFETKALGYDNVHRNMLVGVLYRDRSAEFCRFLRRKFPEYESFTVYYSMYPDLVDSPDKVLRQIAYRCAGTS